MKDIKAHIVATVGPASEHREVLKMMIEHGLDIVRLNFSWGDLDERVKQIALIRELAAEVGKHIPILIDLPGPRVNYEEGHGYDNTVLKVITEEDKGYVKFGVEQGIEYFALSFVGGAHDVVELRELIASFSGNQKIIAKIERKVAVDNLDEILSVTDAVMIARGDLGNEVPLPEIPFVQEGIIKKCNAAGKPVITATEMLLSMAEKSRPTRAEVTDVAMAVMQGTDAVMLSEETARGKYPAEAVLMMESIIIESEKHRNPEKVVLQF